MSKTAMLARAKAQAAQRNPDFKDPPPAVEGQEIRSYCRGMLSGLLQPACGAGSSSTLNFAT